MAVYKDWIPEGEDTGGQGRGFQDYIPAPEPEKKDIKKIEKEIASQAEPVKGVVDESPSTEEIIAPRIPQKKGKK